jgi:hypothetical protein
MFAEIARAPEKRLAQQRRCWRVDAGLLKITLATASDGASRSAHLSLHAWPMRRSLVVSLSFVTLWT